jgi:PilZ domain
LSLIPDKRRSFTIVSGGCTQISGMELVAGRQEERFDTTLAVRLEEGGGIARNVSASGIYFVTDVALEAGATVSFALDFQNFPGGPIQVNCVARIVRVEAQGAKNGVAAAIQSFEFHRLSRATPSS